MLILQTKFSKLDNQQEYYLHTNRGEIWFFWVGFYVGKLLERKVALFPYPRTWENNMKVLKISHANSAAKAAQVMVNAINKHEAKRKRGK